MTPEVRFALAGQALADRDWPAAVAYLEAVIQAQPEAAAAWGNLALARERLGQFAEAEAAHLRALELAPESADLRVNFAAFQLARENFAEARRLLRQALAVAPGHAAAWSNLGMVLACLKKDREAESCYRTALALEGECQSAHFNLGYLLLRRQPFDPASGPGQEGWDYLEHRQLPGAPDRAPWQGESLAGKWLLIWGEGGLGDMIQYSRFLPALRQRLPMASLALACPPALHRLLVRLPGVDRCVCLDETTRQQADEGAWFPLASLPWWFGRQGWPFPAGLPYLPPAAFFPDPPARKPPLRIGLVWQGNPAFENDRHRSLPDLTTLAPWFALPGIRWVSLQTGPAARQLADCPFPIEDRGSQLRDFAETAAALGEVDLVITVDTAMAHLCGALARPAWVLLPWLKTDWRWGCEGEQSLWYPAVLRLFRQPALGDWTSVISDVGQALELLPELNRN